jgi:hypothetical protein
MKIDYLLDRQCWSRDALVSSTKPAFSCPNKQHLYHRAFADQTSSHDICYSRWSDRNLPLTFSDRCSVEIASQSGYFNYAATTNPDEAIWHLNFANDDVFAYWSSSLFAQDEIQVAEHPDLIHLRLAATSNDISMMCLEDGKATPILITNVERRLDVVTTPSKTSPAGLYGNRFRTATLDELDAALTVIKSADKTNILAIEAPAYGAGYYNCSDILLVLQTAYSGFAASRDESIQYLGATTVCLNTGFWGCGAYGGNKTLMLVLQMLAADLARLDRIVFFTGENGSECFSHALAIYMDLKSSAGINSQIIVSRLAEMEFLWGESDGN